jgi:uncharacterized protein (TIGR02588 family)
MNHENESRRNLPRSTAEWVSLGIALMILAVVTGIVISLWLQPKEETARFTIETGGVRVEAEQFYVTVMVTNLGDETAAQVKLVGTLTLEGREETAETTFDYIPSRSSERAVLIFSRDPARAIIRVASYQVPY